MDSCFGFGVESDIILFMKKIILAIISIIVIVIGIVVYLNFRSGPTTVIDKPSESKYLLSLVNNEPAVLDAGELYIQFLTNEKFAARFCNLYQGDYVLENGVFKIDILSARKTKTFCMGKIGEIESLFDTIVSEGANFTVNEDQIILAGQDDSLTFAKIK